MAEKRMFSKKIVDVDSFLDMPATARLLYYDLAMRADDDGFVGSPRGIMRLTGATNDDMNILLMRGFVLTFETGVIVIRHWRLHNYIQKDRYKPTEYTKEKARLSIDESGAYEMDTECIQPVSNPCPQIRDRYRDRLDSGQVRLEENNTLTLKGSSICATGFDEFWAAYPRKKNKEQARKAFQKLKGVKLQELLDAIERQKHSRDWTKDGGQYIPYPATWLNAGGWEDEVGESADGLDNLRNLYAMFEEEEKNDKD
jgi:hypothetical protein